MRTQPKKTSFKKREFVPFFTRLRRDIAGFFFLIATTVIAVSLYTYDPYDPSWNTAVSANTQNKLGSIGAHLADFLFQLLGLSAWLLIPVGLCWAMRLFLQKKPFLLPYALSLILSLSFCILLLTSLVFYKISLFSLSHFHFVEGALGPLLFINFYKGLMHIPWQAPPFLIVTLLFIFSFFFYSLSLALPWQFWHKVFHILGSCITISSTTLFNLLRKILPLFFPLQKPDIKITSHSFEKPLIRKDPLLEVSSEALPSPTTPKTDAPTLTSDPIPLQEEKISPLKKSLKIFEKSKKTSEDKALTAPSFLELHVEEDFSLPPLNLLKEPFQKKSSDVLLSPQELENKAKELEAVLEEFGIKGEIHKVRPGPVVTLYELTPAPGIKSSRVISLADDIARSMSALSVRVAVIPGQNAIGIELPNEHRETVFLRELLETPSFEQSASRLALALGKDIGGAPITVDLARMPHLLVAGTTGSGKSVAINTMILSLLYRLPPHRCKFIMIDPKMLELSIYEGIPHLLAPVVTDPKKAIVALKWTVREMEERYRSMAKLGVRNIDGYNLRIAQAFEKGENLARRVQTGFDPDTGQPIFEDQPLNLEPLPYIVVIVDEMADLMLVAGKEIESAIQRLAQMARAAGIHLIMATQRPSVDVITGTIKANFPTRISFQVTSKIDSRTILGEQGAEQLLGQGDMLYMAAGGRITRIHGPFVSDEEVERIVSFLRSQGEPAYIEDVTQEEDSFSHEEGKENEGNDSLYKEAVSLVLQEQKVSTSFLQRHFQIGYNRAARLVDQMEKNGIIGPANHVGKRNILIQ